MTLDADITSLSKQMGRSKKLKKPLIPPNTKTLELNYYRQLKQIVNILNNLTKEIIIPALPVILESAEMLRPITDRQDDYSDEIDQAMTILRIQTSKQLTNNKKEQMALNVADNVESQNSRYYNRLVKQMTGIQAITNEPWLSAEISTFVKSNTKLIESIEEQYFERIEGIITRGAQTGKLAKDIGVDIQKAVGVSENKAALIARDQVSKFNGNLNKLRQNDVGVKKYEWQTAGDERVRDSHESLNGRIRSWKDSPIPGEEINCRCVAIPVFE